MRIILLLLALASAPGFAGVTIGGTRFIYNQENKQATVTVSNPENKAYLIQSWINKELEDKTDNGHFITTPPLFRLNARADNEIRIIKISDDLPTDRESLFWLNIKIIPSSDPDAKNQLQINIRNRMKLFYRPAGLKGEPSQAYKQLKLTKAAGGIKMQNPTPYYISFQRVSLNSIEIASPPMIGPFQTLTIPLEKASGNLRWTVINDYGGISDTAETHL